MEDAHIDRVTFLEFIRLLRHQSGTRGAKVGDENVEVGPTEPCFQWREEGSASEARRHPSGASSGLAPPSTRMFHTVNSVQPVRMLTLAFLQRTPL